MAWTDLQPLSSTSRVPAKFITVGISSNGNKGRFQHWLSIVLRATELDLDWLKLGNSIKVQFSEDGTSGAQLRLSPSGPFVLCKGSGPAGKDLQVLNLRLPALRGQHPDKFTLTRCQYEIEPAQKGLVITLPAWASPPVPAPLKSVEAPPPGQPFKIGAPSHAAVNSQRAR